eukprot:g37858.t1
MFLCDCQTWYSTTEYETYKLLPLSARLATPWIITPTSVISETMLSMICSVQLTPSGEEHLSSMIRNLRSEKYLRLCATFKAQWVEFLAERKETPSTGTQQTLTSFLRTINLSEPAVTGKMTAHCGYNTIATIGVQALSTFYKAYQLGVRDLQNRLMEDITSDILSIEAVSPHGSNGYVTSRVKRLRETCNDDEEPLVEESKQKGKGKKKKEKEKKEKKRKPRKQGKEERRKKRLISVESEDEGQEEESGKEDEGEEEESGKGEKEEE